MRILYAEDEKQLSAAVSEVLEMKGYEVDCVYDGEEAIMHLSSGCYDAAVLDIMMPKKDGIEVLKTMREKADYTPVLMLTARTSADDRIDSLNTGADDYLGKPFLMKELIAHLSSMIRRSVQYKDRLLSYSNITLDCETGELKSRTGSLRLSYRETSLLALLIKHPSFVFSAERINSVLGEEGSAQFYIACIKNKLRQIHSQAQIAEEKDGWCLK